MNCTDLTDSELLHILKSDTESVITRVINCFNNLYYNDFMKVSWGVIFNKRNYSRVFREQVERDAFNEGLCAFYFFVRDDKYVRGNASLKTVFLEFCKYKLMGKIKDEERRIRVEIREDVNEIINHAKTYTDVWEDVQQEEAEREAEYQVFITAWQNLGERCRNLLTWRKYQKLKNDEIGKLCNISADSVNNEVYRCFVGLKKKCIGLGYNPN